MPKIQIPYNFEERTYQRDFRHAPQRFKVAVWHRRAGKSLYAFNEQIAKTQEKPGIYYYILPTYRQAKQVIWDSMVKKHVPMQLVSKLNESELAIYWKNGSIQRLVGCEDYDKHRGIAPIDVVFDEYSEMSEEMWTAIIQPVLRQNGGSATFIFTPKGRNHSWRLYQAAKVDPDWHTSILTANDTDAISEEDLEKARESTPEALFMQEYMCEFAEGSGQAFRRIRENIYREPQSYNEYHAYKMGVDLAKYNDYTVLTVLDLNTFFVLPQESFRQVDWNLQKARIEAKAYRFKNPPINMDATGVGDPIVEDCARAGLDVTPIKFNKRLKKDMLMNLSINLEQDKVKIPNDEELIAQLESFKFEITDKGEWYIVSDAAHDDKVMSLALALWESEKIDSNYSQFVNNYESQTQESNLNSAI